MSRRVPEEATTERVVLNTALPTDLHLLVVGPDGETWSHRITSSSVLLGRSHDADMKLDHASISRRHALLRIEGPILLEDCGSTNGIRVRGRTFRVGEVAEVRIGEQFYVGELVCMVQQDAVPATTAKRRIWPHGSFELRVDEECARAAGSTFAVVHVRVDRALEGEALLTRLQPCLERNDIIGSYGPGQLELLLSGVDAGETAGRCERLVVALTASFPAVAAAAIFPLDGRDAARLLSTANRRLLATVSAASTDKSGVDVSEPSLTTRRPYSNLSELVSRVAKSGISIVLHGETGVGKEVMAREIHRQSPRAQHPFVALNCATFSDTLLESELFGHEKGAFSGAVAAKPGLFETAEKGTVLLDEVGDLPLATQARLLRAIEERQVQRVGGLQPRSIDVRFVAASHKSLEREVKAGRFRADLFYRLNGITIEIPPLRERRDEIRPLVSRFIGEFAARLGQRPPDVDEDAFKLLESYDWPGNIRELRNVIERAVVLTTDGVIRVKQLPAENMSTPDVSSGRFRVDAGVQAAAAHASANPPTKAPAVATPPQASDDASDEKARILEALQVCAGNQTQAAAMLGISRSTLVVRLNTYGIARPRKR